jgi:hypothetical protein
MIDSTIAVDMRRKVVIKVICDRKPLPLNRRGYNQARTRCPQDQRVGLEMVRNGQEY